MMPPKSTMREGSKAFSLMTTKKNFERQVILNLSFLASKNDTSSAKESLQFFPGINT
jgi:hypothetical protein